MEAPQAPARELPNSPHPITAGLQAALNEFRARTRTISAVLARSDGILISHSLPIRGDPKAVSAMGATIVGTAGLTVTETANGTLTDVLIQGDKGKVFARLADQDVILIVSMEAIANVGLILLEVERTVKRVRRILSGAAP